MSSDLVGTIAIIDLVVAIGWLYFLLRLDRYRHDKNSIHAVLLLFALGTLSVVVTAALYRILRPAIVRLPWMDSPIAADFFYEFIFVGPVEEISKFLIFAIVVVRQKTIKEPLDGLLQAASVALAFAVAAIVAAAAVHGLYNWTIDIGVWFISILITALVTFLAWHFYKALVAESPYVHGNRAIDGLATHSDSYLLNRRAGFACARGGRYVEALDHFSECAVHRPFSSEIRFFQAVAMMGLTTTGGRRPSGLSSHYGVG